MNTSRANPLTITAASALILFCLGVLDPLAVTLIHANMSGRVFEASALVGLSSLYVGAASMLLGLARTARERQWDWFVLVLALGPVGTLLYGLRTTTGATVSC